MVSIKKYVALRHLKDIKPKLKPRLQNYEHGNTSDIRKVNILPPKEEQEIEYRKLNTKNRESVLCFGCNSNGEILVARITIQDNKAIVWIQLKTKNGKTYFLPKDKLWNVPKTDASCFAAGGLRIRCSMAFRKWRISFNGILREETKGEVKDVHVKFGFIWTASSAPFDSLDIPDKTLSSYLANLTWNSRLPDRTLLPKVKDVISQSGNLMGTVSVDGEEETEVFLWGGRLRSFGISEEEHTKEYLAYFSDGEFVYVVNTTQPKPNKRFLQGLIVYSSSHSATIEKIQIEENADINLHPQIKISEGKHCFTLNFGDKLSSTVLDVGFGIKEEFCVSKVQLSEENNGHALVIRTESSTFNVEVPQEDISHEKDKLLVYITSELCKCVDLTGGKGSSLAQLTSKSQVNKNFKVPSGFVVTTYAYKMFSESNDLQRILKNTDLYDIAWGIKKGDLKAVCEKSVDDISQLKLPEAILKSVKEYVNELGDLLFAVRSSASGEDSEEMSAAGQMDTFLGVKGVVEISKAIVKCWASQFSHNAIQYKRQNGQELNSPMAVVVQEMIPSEKAGVMFTCNPLTGNPQNITITANYGLGESVVSATADPDTIKVTRDSAENLKVENIKIGGKSLKISLTDNGGTQEEKVSDQDIKKCCLSNDEALDLAILGIELENDFGCPLDIEWAFDREILYLLQARPVTTFDRESDFEIIHGTDSQVRSEEDYFSKANVGEVMPGALHELGVNIIFQIMDLSMQKHWIGLVLPRNPYMERVLFVSSKHVLNNTEGFYKSQGSSEELNNISKGYLLCMVGRIIDDEKIIRSAIKRNQYQPPFNGSKIAVLLAITKNIFKVEKGLQKCEKFVKNYKLDMDKALPAQEFYLILLRKILEVSSYKYISCHIETTGLACAYNTILLSTLASANKGSWNESVFSDFSLLLTSCDDVESADVPFALQILANSIKECISPDDFKSMKTEEAVEWLQTSGNLASVKYKEFMEKHGHRCLKEFDVGAETWRMNPRQLVFSLQEMVLNVGIKEKSHVTTNEAINNLKSPLTRKTRSILKFIVPLCKATVQRRERSKSIFMRAIDYLRIEFNTLGEKMVQEGRLPDSKLLFHLTIHEIDELLRTRSPKLIQKAIRRKNLHPILDSYRFTEIQKGIPKPINYQSSDEFKYKEGDLLLKGTAVSQGIVKAPVRVANNLEEASQIKAGEILIAYSTDIGWSPYFPLLKGVVTELGGLISHGAVVAREYGIPCVVSLHGATTLLKTGEMVILDGYNGTLQRILE